MTHLHLDPNTFLFFMFLFGMTMAAISYSTSVTMGNAIEGLKEWSCAMLAAGDAFLFFYLRDIGPDLVSYYLANVVLLLVPILACASYANFLRVRIPKKTIGVVSIIGLAMFTYGYINDYTKVLLSPTIHLPVAFLMVTSALMLVRNINYRVNKIAIVAAFFTILFAIALSLSSSNAIFLHSNGFDFITKAGAQFAFLVLAAVSFLVISMSFIFMVHEQFRKDILESARRDGLTGLYTRSAFFESVAAFDAGPEDQPYSVVMVDIDFFKKINDTYGHASGDIALMQTAKLISNSIRSTDYVGRYGGEEFCLFLTGCGKDDVGNFANRLVKDASRQRVTLPGGVEINLTISAGYATRTEGRRKSDNVKTVKDFIDEADQALLIAKRTGRNKAVESGMGYKEDGKP